MISLNPLNLLKIRKVKTFVPHFAQIKLKEEELFNFQLEIWIEKKLKSRYFIVRKPTIIDNLLKQQTILGFEDHSELSYFLLSCPHIRRN